MSLSPSGCPLPLTLPAGWLTSTSTKCFMGDFTPGIVLLMTAGCVKSQVTKYGHLKQYADKIQIQKFRNVSGQRIKSKPVCHSYMDKSCFPELHIHICTHTTKQTAVELTLRKKFCAGVTVLLWRQSAKATFWITRLLNHCVWLQIMGSQPTGRKTLRPSVASTVWI